MLELGIGADIVRGIGLLIWLAFFACLAFALWIGKNRRNKVMGAVLVILLFIAPAAPGIYRTVGYKHNYAKAKALFDERCKTAGEKVYRTVDGVEGVLLTATRPDDRAANRANPNWASAGLPNEAGGEDYVRSFLSWEHRQYSDQRGYLNSEPVNPSGFQSFRGYRFVDVGEADGVVYRYRFERPPSSKLSRVPVTGEKARYAVSFTNAIDSNERALWVAGTTVKVTDTRSGELVALSTWYSIEPGQGDIGGARAPWGFAQTCPNLLGSAERSPTRYFVDQILKPIKGE